MPYSKLTNADFITSDPEKHISEAVPYFMRLGLPKGFKIILTKDVVPGQEVFLLGTRDGAAGAYGPHTVTDDDKTGIVRVWLRNRRDKVFSVCSEELLVKE